MCEDRRLKIIRQLQIKVQFFIPLRCLPVQELAEGWLARAAFAAPQESR